MIVQSMNHDEIFNEISEDLNYVFRKYHYVKKDLERYARKLTKFPTVQFTEYTSPRRNRWLYITVFHRRNIHNGGAGVSFACVQKADKGGFTIHEVVVNKYKEEYLVTYHPHFFDRYKQHMKSDKTGIDLIKHFFRNNLVGETDVTDAYSGKKSRDKDAYHVCYNEGIGLGEVLGANHAQLTTYITYDMAMGEQKKAFDKLRKNNELIGKEHKEMWYGDKELDIEDYIDEHYDELCAL